MLTAGRSLACLTTAGANSRLRSVVVRQHGSTHCSTPDSIYETGWSRRFPAHQPVGLRLHGAHRRQHQHRAAQGGSSSAPTREQLALSANDFWTAPIADVLIVDATNRAVVSAADAGAYAHVDATLPAIFEAWLAYLRELLQPTLCIAVFDAPRGTTASRRQHAVPDYLRKRHEKLQQRQTGAQPALSQQTQRARQAQRPRLHDIAEAAGYVVAVASHGWEADDVIGALCAAADAASLTAAIDGQRRPPVVVASADADFVAVLSAAVAWLQLKTQPSPSCPAACRLVTAEEFAVQRGFSASAQPAFLALTGKPEAGIRGIGIGSSAAQKLVRRYHTVSTIHTVSAIVEAAECGELAGWGPNVRRAFSSAALPATREQLRRNLAAVSICRDASILPPELAASVADVVRGTSKALQEAPPASGDHPQSHALSAVAEAPARLSVSQEAERARRSAWSHPDNALRWQHVAPHAAALGDLLTAAGIAHAVQHALPNGCTMDVAVPGACVGDTSESSPPTAIMLRTACDLVAGSDDVGPGQLLSRLSGRARHHRKLLTRFGWVVLDCDCTGQADLSGIVDTLRSL